MEEEENNETENIRGSNMNISEAVAANEETSLDTHSIGDARSSGSFQSKEGNSAICSLDAEAMDDSHFEQVSLADMDSPSGSCKHSISNQSNDRESFDEYGGSPQLLSRGSFGDLAAPRGTGQSLSSPGAETPHEYDVSQSYSSIALDLGPPLSPSGSPVKSKQKSSMPNVSPELLHLIDSAIMGKPESLAKLENVVCGAENFGSVDEADGVAYVVVDSLLATMGGVESFEDGDSNPPSVMLNSRAAIISAELIPWLPCIGDNEYIMSPRTRMVRGLLAILRACTRNRAMCSMAGLLGVLLRAAETIFVSPKFDEQKEWDGAPLCHCIQLLASHSLNAVDLRRWLEIITSCLTTAWATPLMNSLEKSMTGKESKGPASTFEFDGESSGLLGPGESRWPFVNGYAFATWLYIESFADTLNTATAAAAIAAAAAAKSGKSSAMSAAAAASALAGEGTAHMPRLFSFLSADNQGIEAYFHAQFLVVECGSGKGKKASLHFTHAFKPQCWYFICLEHVSKHGLIGRTESELRLYVDGTLFESRPFEFPRITKPLAFCCIGTNPPPTIAGLQRRRRQCPLFSEMGPVYIFKEPIGHERVSRLASRGGDALPSFGNGAGLPWQSSNNYVRSKAEESSLLDAEIGGFIHLLYHPSLLSGRYCPDASPSSAAGVTRRSAEVLGQVHVATRIRPMEALWTLACGGPMSLLPLLISVVNKNTMEPVQGDETLSLATAALAPPIFRIISLALHHPANNDELCIVQGPYILSNILNYLLRTLAILEAENRMSSGNEELVAAVVSLCHSQNINYELKIQLFRTLLLDLKIWSLCSYGVQKKLLSSLADMVYSESLVMRDANAIQLLLDSCRSCYWTVREKDSANAFVAGEEARPIGECNALVDELLVIIELLMGSASPSVVVNDIRCLLGFIVDCPQPNQVSRVLHLIYRLIIQPNASRAHVFAQTFITCGGIETLLVLLQREAKCDDVELTKENDDNELHPVSEQLSGPDIEEESEIDVINSTGDVNLILPEKIESKQSTNYDTGMMIQRRSSGSEMSVKNIGGISLSICADSARNNVYNVDTSDCVVVAIIGLIGALVSSGHLSFDSREPSNDYVLNDMVHESGSTMFNDKVSLILFALFSAFQAAPNRLMTTSVYTALLAASIDGSIEVSLGFYDSGYRFEHLQLLAVLLRSLPFASRNLQSRALQDLLILACSHPDNRNCLTKMELWPEWILELLILNCENGESESSGSTSAADIDDLVHNFLNIMLEYSMREKDGWKDIEATLHCAEWLCIVGGSSTGEQRVRREKALPVFKRRLLGDLLEFATRELQLQTQVIAAASAVVAAEGLSPDDSKAETEVAAQFSVALVENSIVILMLVEDHLRLQSKTYCSSLGVDSSPSPLLVLGAPMNNRVQSVVGGNPIDISSYRKSDVSGGLPIDVLTSMADANGKISAAVMERLTAAAAAEPYESVSCAFVSYGGCCKDLAEGWKYRSRLWFGVGAPSKPDAFGGGGSGWDSWSSTLEKDLNGNWVDLCLVKKSVSMLQALLLDETGLGGGLGIGGGSGTGMGGMSALYQLLDSDQPFLCMLRMVLLSMREEDTGDTTILKRPQGMGDVVQEGFQRQTSSMSSESSGRLSTLQPRSALLWSVLSPVLNMHISDSKRQRVLVASCVLYSEVWHSVGMDGKALRKQYLEGIIPPFVALLRRWRPVLSGIHELATADGINPLVSDDRALAADVLPIEAALSMISPAWAAAFASPPAAMALAMIAAGAGGGETPAPPATMPLKRDASLLERKTVRLQTFSSFQKPLGIHSKVPTPAKDKAAAKAAALAAARDLQRNAKIGSGRGLSAVAMATSAQRRNASDAERVSRWSVNEAMSIAWIECLQSVDSKSVYGKDFNALSYKFIAVLVASFALARNIQRSEVDRRSQINTLTRYQFSRGRRAWRKLILRLLELNCLFGPFKTLLTESEKVFWTLDRTETASRMRRYLKRNTEGSDHFGAAANYEDQSYKNYGQGDVPVVSAEAILVEGLNEDDDHAGNIQENQVSSTELLEKHQSKLINDGQEARSESDFTQLGKGQESDISPSTIPGVLRNEFDERIVLELSSSMVRTLNVIKGTFQVTTSKICFIVCVSTVENDSCNNIDREKEYSWPISSLHQIYSRRYLLRRSALELFMVDRSNFFFDFESSECRRNAYRAIVQLKPPHLNNIYLATQRPEQLLKRTQLMDRWARWEISNFEYLMQLNTLAGRTYNDITQYPVFPWILSDYISKTLDLSSPSSYRDLSKPVGALNPDRLEKFKERYSSFDDPVIPKFHYGSHYSSAGTVLYYLVRMEPFTTLSIQLQGGKFDHADRMFSDIAATWNGVLEDMSDVKELVPELFYLPEILKNENSIDYGTTQLGEKLDLVKLPPWASDPVDFVQKNRMALESEHASAHLHEWIDLIFGYKQRGKEAIAANNVFFYITYEGAVDIDKISDPFLQRATQDQIAYFGQTPSQLLTVPHVKRLALSDVLHLQTIFRNPSEVKAYAVPGSERCNLPASAIHASSDSITIVDMNVPAARIAQHKWQPNTPDDQGTPFHFQHGKPSANAASGAFKRMFKSSGASTADAWQYPQAQAFISSSTRNKIVVAITCDKEIITGGHADNTVKLVSSDGAKTIESALGHYSPVTCLALSPDSNYLVTGSSDTILLLWRLHRPYATSSTSASDGVTVTPSNTSNVANEKTKRKRIEGPLHVLRGHQREITCCCVNSDLGVVVSCSHSSDVILHSIKKGRILRTLKGVEAHALSLSNDGIIVVWNKNSSCLSTFTVNGEMIKTANMPLYCNVSCMELSGDGRFALIGTSSLDNDGSYNNWDFALNTSDSGSYPYLEGSTLDVPFPAICVLDLYLLKVVHVLRLGDGQNLTAMALNHDNTNLVVSTVDKQLIIFTNPALSVKMVDQMLKLGWEGDGLRPLIKQ